MQYLLNHDDTRISFGIIFTDSIEVIDSLSTKINQDIVFVETKTWRVYEHYTINNIGIKNKLGLFKSDTFQYVSTTNQSFIGRRSDFQGYHMKAMVEGLLPYNEVHISTAVFDENSQTYDVTQSVKGMFYEMFLVMQKYLNFTSSLHKRKDGKWGPSIILENGTLITGGIIHSVASGFAEMLIARFVLFCDL